MSVKALNVVQSQLLLNINVALYQICILKLKKSLFLPHLIGIRNFQVLQSVYMNQQTASLNRITQCHFNLLMSTPFSHYKSPKMHENTPKINGTPNIPNPKFFLAKSRVHAVIINYGQKLGVVITSREGPYSND